MMPPERLSEVERLQRHREELQLAIAQGLPLMTARRICQERRRQARSRQAPATPPLPPIEAEGPETPRFWWQRD